MIIKLFCFTFLFLSTALLGTEKSQVIHLTNNLESIRISSKISYFEDPTKKLKIENILTKDIQEKFIPLKTNFPNLGIKDRYYWLKLKVKDLSEDKRWVLSYDFVTQDHIWFYQKDKKTGKYGEEKTGDYEALSKRQFEVDGFNFFLKTSKEAEDVFYFKIGGFAKQPVLIIYSYKSFAEAQSKNNLVKGLVLGTLTLMVFFIGYLAVFENEKVYLLYFNHAFFMAICLSLGLGILPVYITKNMVFFNNTGMDIILIISMVSLVYFFQNILKSEDSFRGKIMILFFNFLKSLTILLLILILFMPRAIAAKYIVLSIFIVYPALLIFLLLNLKIKNTDKFFLFLGLFSTVAAGLIFALVVLGHIPSNFYTRHTPIMGFFFEVFFLTIGLLLIQERRKKENYQEKIDAKSKIIDLMKDQKEIQKKYHKEKNESLRKQAQHNLISTTHLLKEKTKKVEFEINEIRKKSLERELFLARLGHDLRNPLNNITSFVHILENFDLEINPEEKMLYLKNIRSSCREIMDLSNVGDSVFHDDVESKSVERKGIDLGYILNDLISFFNYKGKDKNITFNLKYENKGLPSPLVLGARKIREILQNVFNNSLEISNKGGKINVHVSFDKVKENPLSYDIIIKVIDETEGIEEEDCLNLFIPYLDTFNEKEKNQKVDHMGLYISKVLLLKIGSDLTIKSSLGKGNTFKIHLKNVLKGLSGGLIFSPATIILGFKNKNVLNDLIEQLKNQPFEFIFAKNGEELIKKAMKEKADLIIAENDLRIIDTLTVRKNLACLPKLKNIPFLIIKDELSNSMNKTQIESFDDVLLSPFQNEKLLETLAQFLKNEIIEIEEETIAGDSEIKSFFSEAENDLKKYLERKKDVCSKDELKYLKKLKEQIEYLIESKEMEFRTKMYDDFLSTISNIDGNELQNWFMGLMNFTESDDQNELKSFLVDSLLELENSIKLTEK